MATYRLQTSVHLTAPLAEVFAFFSDPRNLEAITPPWLQFRMLGAADPTIGEGTLIDYRLRVHGIPFSWRSEIVQWAPPRRFVDRQVRGPYREWVHEHRFHSTGNGTVCEDRVSFSVPLGALLVPLFVRHDVEQIFQFRHRRLIERFGSMERPASQDRPLISRLAEA